ncbi:MAG: hypothetical protein Q9226_008985, partial [Calogaya cf. arnoldii]
PPITTPPTMPPHATIMPSNDGTGSWSIVTATFKYKFIAMKVPFPHSTPSAEQKFFEIYSAPSMHWLSIYKLQKLLLDQMEKTECEAFSQELDDICGRAENWLEGLVEIELMKNKEHGGWMFY